MRAGVVCDVSKKKKKKFKLKPERLTDDGTSTKGLNMKNICITFKTWWKRGFDQTNMSVLTRCLTLVLHRSHDGPPSARPPPWRVVHESSLTVRFELRLLQKHEGGGVAQQLCSCSWCSAAVIQTVCVTCTYNVTLSFIGQVLVLVFGSFGQQLWNKLASSFGLWTGASEWF